MSSEACTPRARGLLDDDRAGLVDLLAGHRIDP